MKPITFDIDLKKIDQKLLPSSKPDREGNPTRYAKFACLTKKGGPANEGFVVQSVTKEQRDKNIRGPIVGNWKNPDASAGGGTEGDSRPSNPPSPSDVDV